MTLRFAGLLLALAPALTANTLCSSLTTLSQYDALGAAGCQAGDVLFSNFVYSYTFLEPGGSPVIADNQVTVSVGGSATAPTLNFSAGWIVSNGFQGQLQINFTTCAVDSTGACTSTPIAPIASTSVAFTGMVEELGLPANFPSSITTNLNLLPQGGSVTTLHPSLKDSACASPPTGCPLTATVTAGTGVGLTDQLTVGDQFLLDSGGTGGASPNTVSLTTFSQTFSVAPEPATICVVGLGLLGIGSLAWRKSRRAR